MAAVERWEREQFGEESYPSELHSHCPFSLATVISGGLNNISIIGQSDKKLSCLPKKNQDS